MITDFLQEFDYLKFVGERLLLPQITAGNFYFSYYEYKENGKVCESVVGTDSNLQTNKRK